jgi:hypothetical protein
MTYCAAPRGEAVHRPGEMAHQSVFPPMMHAESFQMPRCCVQLEVKPGYRGRQNAYPAQVVTNSLSSGQLGVFDAF